MLKCALHRSQKFLLYSSVYANPLAIILYKKMNDFESLVIFTLLVQMSVLFTRKEINDMLQ